MNGTTREPVFERLEPSEKFLIVHELAQLFAPIIPIAFTWSPNPSRFHAKTFRKQWQQMIGAGLQFIPRCSHAFSLIPEITIDGRLHCHGFILITDYVKWHKSVLPRLRSWGFVCIKQHYDQKWLDYCMEDLDETLQIMGSQDIPYGTYDCAQWRLKDKEKMLRRHLKTEKIKPKCDIIKYFLYADMKDKVINFDETEGTIYEEGEEPEPTGDHRYYQ